MTAASLVTLDNPVFKAYIFYSCILVVKVLFMGLMTGRLRVGRKLFAAPEDYNFFGGNKQKVPKTDDDIERIRRAHLNDLENIPVFFVAAFAFVLTNPNFWLANNLFRAFTFARIAHSIVYAFIVVPQPARAVAFFVGYGITVYMAVMSLIAFY